jgi:hypothetical protein
MDCSGDKKNKYREEYLKELKELKGLSPLSPIEDGEEEEGDSFFEFHRKF